jgi:hypothetical protein
VRFLANFLFSKGRINLIEDTLHKVELYQDDLSVKFSFRRDTTLEVSIGNRSVGLNVIDLNSGVITELVGRQAR